MCLVQKGIMSPLSERHDCRIYFCLLCLYIVWLLYQLFLNKSIWFHIPSVLYRAKNISERTAWNIKTIPVCHKTSEGFTLLDLENGNMGFFMKFISQINMFCTGCKNLFFMFDFWTSNQNWFVDIMTRKNFPTSFRECGKKWV